MRSGHSPLGGSSAERWINCPGSVALINELHLPVIEEPDYRTLGTAAHEAACKCLSEGLEAWEVCNEQFGKHIADPDLVNAIQLYLDECNYIIRENPGGQPYCEFQIDDPTFHPQFYGTCDFAYVVGVKLFVRDYKHGEGIAVDVEENPQLMYYAYGVLRKHPEIEEVDLGIVQPRGYHPDGDIRIWKVKANYIREWAENTLRPAMGRVALDNDLVAGSHCRFCPAKLVCPLMASLFGAAMVSNPDSVVQLTDDTLGRSYQMVSVVKFYLKALEDETYRRLNQGREITGTKLVNKKADRVFKDGAAQEFRVKFGRDAFTEPELKTPAQMEKLNERAREMVAQWAYTPVTGTTVALEKDNRPAIKIHKPSEVFAQVTHGEIDG